MELVQAQSALGENLKSSENSPAQVKPLPCSKDQMASLKKQLEFYFSNSNLRRDKFMQSKLQECRDSMMHIDILLTFNRIKQILNIPKTTPVQELQSTENRSIICKAVKDSDLLLVSNDGTKLGRKEKFEIGSQKRDFNPGRTVMVHGFPVEATFDEVDQTLNAGYDSAKIDYIRLRRVPKAAVTPSKSFSFCGTVFVELKQEKYVQECCDKSTFVCKGNTCSVEPMPEWLSRVRKEKEGQKKLAKQEPKYKFLALLTGFEGLVDREDIKEALDDDRTVWVCYSRGESEAIIRFVDEDQMQQGLNLFEKNMERFRAKVLKKKLELSTTVENEGEGKENETEGTESSTAKNEGEATDSNGHENSALEVKLEQLTGSKLDEYSKKLAEYFRSKSKTGRRKKRYLDGKGNAAHSKKVRR